MTPDYLVFSGTEILNTGRLQAYINNGFAPMNWEFKDCSCDTIGPLLGETYTTPQADEAPWVNPRQPESYNFAGLLPLGVEGVEDGVVTRTVTPVLSGGAIIGPERCGPRELRFTALLVGKTCCSINYGLSWFREALRGKDPVDCTNPCGGGTIELLRCCPDCEPAAALVGAAPTELTEVDWEPFHGNDPSVSGFYPAEAGDPCYDQYARCLHNASLVDGPRIIERLGGGCGRCPNSCSMMKIEWTMVAGDPAFYGETTTVVAEEKFIPDPGNNVCSLWTTAIGDEVVDCGTPGGACNQHPNGCPIELPCSQPPPPPVPDDPFVNCGCGMPLDIVRGQIHRLDRDDTPFYGSLVPIINVYAGTEDIRNFSIYFFENRLEWECDRFLDSEGRPEECLACNVITVSYLPRNSVLEINGELGTAEIRSQGNLVSYAAPVLFGKEGSLFTIPSLACATYCVVAVADADNINSSAWWNMSLVKREL